MNERMVMSCAERKQPPPSVCYLSLPSRICFTISMLRPNTITWSKLEVPAEPPFNLPQRPSLATLGTAISDVASLDQKYASNLSELKKAASRTCREWEIQGRGSMYSQLQPFSRPEVSELVGKRIWCVVFCQHWCSEQELEVVLKWSNRGSWWFF
jgi:hypothetical protein